MLCKIEMYNIYLAINKKLFRGQCRLAPTAMKDLFSAVDSLPCGTSVW